MKKINITMLAFSLLCAVPMHSMTQKSSTNISRLNAMLIKKNHGIFSTRNMNQKSQNMRQFSSRVFDIYAPVSSKFKCISHKSDKSCKWIEESVEPIYEYDLADEKKIKKYCDVSKVRCTECGYEEEFRVFPCLRGAKCNKQENCSQESFGPIDSTTTIFQIQHPGPAALASCRACGKIDLIVPATQEITTESIKVLPNQLPD